jgi:hypothetical protein
MNNTLHKPVFCKRDRGGPPLKSSDGGLSPVSQKKMKLMEFSQFYIFFVVCYIKIKKGKVAL